MDISAQSMLLAFGLGLLGFIEPCTIGVHMMFLGSQERRPADERIGAALTFLVARLAVMGAFGGAIVVLGQVLIGVQTGAWLVFGAAYFALGVAIAANRDNRARKRVRIAPEHWKLAANPLLQGLAFGLNIPACAAPILFGLIGMATASGSVGTGFLMMAVFALALSLPLVPLTVYPRLATPLARLAGWLRPRRWLLGLVFIMLGLWSIWFGIFVNPEDWRGR